MASDRDKLLKAFIAAGRKRRKPKSPFPKLPGGGRNLSSVAKGRSDANQTVGRLRSPEPPSGTMRGTYKSRERYYLGHHPNADRSTNPRKAYGPPPQQAPFKPGQTARSRRLRRRTKPTPGSAYRNNRQTN